MMLSLLPAALPSQTSDVYQESGGIVIVEIESAPEVPSWNAETAMTGYTGTCYYTWRGADLFNSPGAGVLSYYFNIAATGSYNFRIRNRHDAADSTLYNDCFTRMDGGAWVKTYSSVRGGWTWNTNHEFSSTDKVAARYDLAAGVHLLEISGRSAEFSLDRFHLYLDSVTNPLDETRPVSSTTGGGTVPPPTPGTEPPPGEEPPVISGYNSDGVFVGFPEGSGSVSLGEGDNGDGTVNDSVCGLLGLEALLLMGLAGLIRRRTA
jgi:hypothetical protein